MIFSTSIVSATMAIAAMVSLLVIYNKATWLLAIGTERVGSIIESFDKNEVSEKDMRCMLEFYERAADGLSKDFLLYAIRSDRLAAQHSEDVLSSLDEKRRDDFCRSLLKMMAWRDPILFVTTLLVLTIKQLPIRVRLFLSSFSDNTTTNISAPDFDTYHLCVDVYRSMRSMPVSTAIAK